MDERLKVIYSIFNRHKYEVVLFIDVNKSIRSSEDGVTKLTQYNHMMDHPMARYNIKFEPNTCQQGSRRMDFVFCTQYIH